MTYRPYPDRDRALRQLARHYPGPPSLRDRDAYPSGMRRIDASSLQKAMPGFRALAEPQGR